MEAWFEVEKRDVIALVVKPKDRLPWGNHPDESYSCLIFRQDGAVWMTVNEFFEPDADTFECCRFYTDRIGDTDEDYFAMSEDEFAAKAYRAWCSGAR